jgi:hypothetical protein
MGPSLALHLGIMACAPVPDPRTVAMPDLRPPTVEGVRTTGPGEIELAFDEEASVAAEKVRIEPPLCLRQAPTSGKKVVLAVEDQVPGRVYCIEATARDARGNSVSFAADFRGFNPRVPAAVINEFTPRGSGNHPDLVEIVLLSDGDMGGVVFCLGTQGSQEGRLIFPSFPVRKGDFILIHFTEDREPGALDEPGDKTASRGSCSSETAYDFWMEGCGGLSANNGVLSLWSSPGGSILDGVLYSTRTSESDEEYRGFGSAATLARAEELVLSGGWVAAEESIRPEDGVNPEGTSGTRSLSRSSASTDTGSAADWHVTPLRGATFGEVNVDEVYVPRKQANPTARSP